jgi:hypothetical protein
LRILPWPSALAVGGCEPRSAVVVAPSAPIGGPWAVRSVPPVLVGIKLK